MTNFNTRSVPLFYSYTIDAKEKEKLDNYLSLISSSGVLKLFKSDTDPFIGGRPPFNPLNLFSTILYGFAFGSSSLRDIEEACKYDLRFIYLMNFEQPTYVSISNFINKQIIPNREKIFSLITLAIANKSGVDIKEDCFIDGTKIEADANKYKFVYKPTTFHIKLSNKIINLLKLLEIDRDIPNGDIIPSSYIALKVVEFSTIIDKQTDDKLKKIQIRQLNSLKDYLSKSIEYEEKERICGPNRNSYYKTDKDATAMCLKEDYYSGLGSNMHAAYNCQVMVAKGLIVTYLSSQSRNDFKDFVPVIKRYNSFYNCFPKRICADSGYGSYENYKYLKENNIENYVKSPSWEGNVSGRNPDSFRLKDDETIVCLNGHEGKKVNIDYRHPKRQEAVFFKVVGWKECPFSSYCKRYQKNKDEDYKIFEVVINHIKLKEEAENNLLSIKGIEMRVNRSIQAEGAIGVVKQDMNYTRSRRTTIEKVDSEYMLTFLGYNLRKLFRYYDGNLKLDFWKCPQNIEPEKFKKPSAKRLSNKINKKKQKSVNQESKSSYKYKRNR